jgi:hypothetical protein
MRNGSQDVGLDTLLREQQRIARQIAHKRAEQLRTLHERLGFASIDELIEALQSVSSRPTNGRHASNGVSAAPAVKRKRGAKAGTNGARYSDDVKAAVKSAIEKGEGTAREIATRYQISLPTLNIWKRGWGLTKPRRKKRKAS